MENYLPILIKIHKQSHKPYEGVYAATKNDQ